MVVERELIHMLNADLETQLPLVISDDKLLHKLSEFVADLIENNFQRLILLLYKVDVSETKLRYLLKESHDDAATLIAKLIIEREAQKMLARNSFRRENNIPDEEKW
jgi:hypothetical protein